MDPYKLAAKIECKQFVDDLSAGLCINLYQTNNNWVLSQKIHHARSNVSFHFFQNYKKSGCVLINQTPG